MKKHKLTTTVIIMLGFLAGALIGTACLMLPVSLRGEQKINFFDALFVAMSSVCVTGLSTVNIGQTFSAFGQVVILLLIQFGGLGIVTFTTLILCVFHRRITLSDRMLIQSAYNLDTLTGLVKLTLRIFKITLFLEGIGAIGYFLVFIPRFGIRGIWYGIFHAVSAFCNAGFDLMGGYSGEYSSFVEFYGDILINLVLMALVILGGIGFFVWSDVRQNKFHFRKYMLHTKITLVVTAVLLAGGTVLYYLFENENLLAGMSAKDKLLASAFSSVTARTAGFNTIDTGGLTNASKLFTMVLMFIGGSPGSTAGGIKTVTMLVLVIYVWSNLRESKGVNIFHRRLDDDVIRKASNVVVISLLLAVASIIFICFKQPSLPVEDVMFEVFSAIGTVGMSTGLTRDLSTSSRIVVILLMYCGRIGSMSFALAFTERKKVPPVQMPVEKIMIG